MHKLKDPIEFVNLETKKVALQVEEIDYEKWAEKIEYFVRKRI